MLNENGEKGKQENVSLSIFLKFKRKEKLSCRVKKNMNNFILFVQAKEDRKKLLRLFQKVLSAARETQILLFFRQQ